MKKANDDDNKLVNKLVMEFSQFLNESKIKFTSTHFNTALYNMIALNFKASGDSYQDFCEVNKQAVAHLEYIWKS